MLYYPSGDDHPSQTGSLKATDEFIELLNIFYHRWTDSIPPVPHIGGCDIFPANNIWNTRVDTLPVHGRSDDWVNTIGRSSGFHMDFGSGTWDGGPIGIPYNLANAGTPRYMLDFYYPDESDPGPYPIPASPLIEYGSDHHILIVDSSTCTLYEIYDARYSGGTWHGGSGATWPLGSNALRPAGWTSADAAGLPILPGLARYDEVAGGKLNHALRFTANQTNGYIWPARHLTSDNPGAPQIPPMGARFRLKASFDISGYPAEMQVILRAMKTYGIILADNGADWYVSGAPDERWDNDMLHRLDDLTGNDFEAVDSSGLMVLPDSGAAQSGGLICYTLTLNSITDEGGDIHASPTPNCHGNAQYPDGTVVTLTARANAGYCFVNWSGDATGEINPTSVTMSANRSVTALFRAMPMLIEPANTATTGSLRPTFDWNDYLGATRYTIQISQNNTFTSLVTNVTIKTAKSNYTPTKNLPAITTYYWRVMARLPDGTSPWSEVYSFTPAPPPSVPTLVTPKRNILITGYRPRLDWDIVSVPNGTTFSHYQVQVDDNSNFSSPVVDANVSGLENHEYTVATDLNPHTKYYWRVRSGNSAGYFSNWPKKALYFRTPSSQPMLVGPVGGEAMTGQMSTFD